MWRPELFVKMIEDMSNGRIKIQLFGGGEIVPVGDILDAVASGALDMGFYNGVYAEVLPVGSIEFGAPFTYTVPVVDVDVIFYHMGLIDIMREAYEEQGVYYIGPYQNDPYSLIATEEAYTVSDLRELKIRAYGPTAKTLENLGISTVYLPAAEMYLGLATGTIDGAIYGGATGYEEMKLQEVAKYYYQPTILASGPSNCLINIDLWNSLPADVKTMLEQGMRAHSTAICTGYQLSEYESIRNMKEVGLKVVQLPQETVDAIYEAAIPVWDEMALADEYSARAMEIVKEWQRLTGRIR